MSRRKYFYFQCAGAKLHLQLRRSSGDFLVEALVSVLVSALLGTAMAQTYAQVHRVGNQSQAQFAAASVAQAAIDHLRSLPYAFVVANAGRHTPQVNGGGNGDALFPRALLRDSSSFVGSGGANVVLDYSAGGDPLVSQGLNNFLQTCDPSTLTRNNTITVTVTPQTTGGSSACQVTVCVVFVDGSSGVRTYSMKSMLTSNGLNG